MSLYSKLELPEQDTGVLSSRLQSLINPSEGNSHFAYRLDFCILWHLNRCCTTFTSVPKTTVYFLPTRILGDVHLARNLLHYAL